MRPGDDQLVRRAARDTGIRAAAVVALAMLLLVGLVTIVVVRGQDAAADRLLRATVLSADDVVDPPPGGWLLVSRNGRVVTSAGLPAAALPALARLRRQATPQVQLASVTPDLRAATVVREGAVFQLLLDVEPAHAQRTRLLQAMVIASGLALLFAAGLGVLLGRRAVRPLAEALTLQRSFIADASHELRTPLTLLSTRAQLLDDELQQAEPQLREDSAGIVHDVQRLGEVLDDLLLSADPRQRQPSEPVELSVLVAEVLRSAQPHARQRGVRLEDRAADAPLLVMGWPPALRRALLSLVDNAIDHTPDGGTVTVTAQGDKRHITVDVADTGPGIAPQAAKDVLRRFHSGGHRAGRAHYGLGLALSNDIANQHGGRLELVPAPVGATFRLTLPALSNRSGGSKTRLRKNGEADTT